MRLNTFKCNCLTPLQFKRLNITTDSVTHRLISSSQTADTWPISATKPVWYMHALVIGWEKYVTLVWWWFVRQVAALVLTCALLRWLRRKQSDYWWYVTEECEWRRDDVIAGARTARVMSCRRQWLEVDKCFVSLQSLVINLWYRYRYRYRYYDYSIFSNNHTRWLCCCCCWRIIIIIIITTTTIKY